MPRYEATGYGATKFEAEQNARRQIELDRSIDQDHDDAVKMSGAALGLGALLLFYAWRMATYFFYWAWHLMLRPLPTLLYSAAVLGVTGGLYVALATFAQVYPGFFSGALMFVGLFALLGLIGGAIQQQEEATLWIERHEHAVYARLPRPLRLLAMAVACAIPLAFAHGAVQAVAALTLRWPMALADLPGTLARAVALIERFPLLAWPAFGAFAVMFAVTLWNRHAAWRALANADTAPVTSEDPDFQRLHAVLARPGDD